MLKYVKIGSKASFCYCKIIECRGSRATSASQIPKSMTKIRKTSLSKCVSPVDVANGDPRRRVFLIKFLLTSDFPGCRRAIFSGL